MPSPFSDAEKNSPLSESVTDDIVISNAVTEDNDDAWKICFSKYAIVLGSLFAVAMIALIAVAVLQKHYMKRNINVGHRGTFC